VGQAGLEAAAQPADLARANPHSIAGHGIEDVTRPYASC
jgi:hypothetical protein